MTKKKDLKQYKVPAQLAGSNESYTELNIPDIGVGRMTTTATTILTILLIEDGQLDRMQVLESVIDYLKIEPEDFAKMKRNEKRNEALDYDNDEKFSWQ